MPVIIRGRVFSAGGAKWDTTPGHAAVAAGLACAVLVADAVAAALVGAAIHHIHTYISTCISM